MNSALTDPSGMDASQIPVQVALDAILQNPAALQALKAALASPQMESHPAVTTKWMINHKTGVLVPSSEHNVNNPDLVKYTGELLAPILPAEGLAWYNAAKVGGPEVGDQTIIRMRGGNKTPSTQRYANVPTLAAQQPIPQDAPTYQELMAELAQLRAQMGSQASQSPAGAGMAPGMGGGAVGGQEVDFSVSKATKEQLQQFAAMEFPDLSLPEAMPIEEMRLAVLERAAKQTA